MWLLYFAVLQYVVKLGMDWKFRVYVCKTEIEREITLTKDVQQCNADFDKLSMEYNCNQITALDHTPYFAVQWSVACFTWYI